jgi:C4-dicarboxylate transporter, DctM subunit
MSLLTIATLMIVGVLVLMALRVPIFLAMALTGAAGYIVAVGSFPFLNYLKASLATKVYSYELSVVPLFLLMGSFATRAGVNRELFTACNAWIGHRRGGLALSAILGCGLFGAICGSSVATATTMTQVALPEMRRHGYAPTLASGTLAAGGTLGILIPPSIVLVIYAILTEQNVSKLFLAALLPGVMALCGFMLTVMVVVRLFPHWAGPVGAPVPWRTRFRLLGRITPVLVVFVTVLGGIYGGIFTPTEGASVGTVLMGIIAVTQGGLRWDGFVKSGIETALTTAMIFAIIYGADLFNVALARTRLPSELADWIAASALSPHAVLLVLLLGYLLLGCVMDSLSMILLTVPIIFPAFMALDFGLLPEQQALWFGILSLIVVELGMITPPVGMNLFIIQAMARDIRARDIFVGVSPFVLAELVRVSLIIALPWLSFGLVGMFM